MTPCDHTRIDIDIVVTIDSAEVVSALSPESNSASAPGSASAARNGELLGARQYQSRNRRPKAPALLLTCLGLCLSLAVLLGAQDVEALLPAGAGNFVYTHPAGSAGMVVGRAPTPPRVGKLCGAHAGGDRDSNAFAQISAPVLELITPDGCASWSTSDTSALIQNVQSAVAGGVSLVQLRDYESSAKSKAEMAVRLVAATSGRALVVVNGDPEAARASGADGVHLPERMMDMMEGLVGARDADDGDAGEWPRVVGCSVHSVAAAVRATRLGADYIQTADGLF
eukprot:g16332.t1